MWPEWLLKLTNISQRDLHTYVRRSRGRHYPKPWTAAAAAAAEDKEEEEDEKEKEEVEEEEEEEEEEEGEMMMNPGKPVKTRSHFHT